MESRRVTPVLILSPKQCKDISALATLPPSKGNAQDAARMLPQEKSSAVALVSGRISNHEKAVFVIDDLFKIVIGWGVLLTRRPYSVADSF